MVDDDWVIPTSSIQSDVKAKRSSAIILQENNA